MTDAPAKQALTTALLVVGHGTRDATGLNEFRQTVELLAQHYPDVVVEHAFLELAAPEIAQGIARCVERGARRLVIQPLLLFAAGHLKRDLPAAVAEATRQFPELHVELQGALNCHPCVLELSALRCGEAMASRNPVADADTLLLLVGRGSLDPAANAEMARFCRLRWERHRQLGWMETCFAAMARPSLEEGLAMAARAGYARVIVQPHLLFPGELSARIAAQTAAFAQSHPQQEWVSTGPLGPHPLLAQAIAGMLDSATGLPGCDW